MSLLATNGRTGITVPCGNWLRATIRLAPTARPLLTMTLPEGSVIVSVTVRPFRSGEVHGSDLYTLR